MIVRRVVPEPGEPVDITADDARDRLAELYGMPDAAWTRINLVVSADGSTRGPDGRSESLSSPADRAILGAIRAMSDAVLVGAGTLRAESALVPRRTRLAVVTTTGDLRGAEIPEGSVRDPILVLGPAQAHDAVERTLDVPFAFRPVDAGEGADLEPAAILDVLHGEGLHRVVCEGGPRLASRFIDAGVVDELCITTSPVLVGATLPPLGTAPRAPVPLHLRSLLVDDRGASYARWAPVAEAAPASASGRARNQSRTARSQRSGS